MFSDNQCLRWKWNGAAAGATQAGTATMTKRLYNLLVTKCTIGIDNTKRENYGCASHLYGGAAQ